MAQICLFHRDFRTVDNLTLNLANKEGKTVYPIFIFDPRQVTAENKYRSPGAIGFMIEAILDMKETIPELELFYGLPERILKHCKGDTVFHIADYTPFARRRNNEIKRVVGKCIEVHDAFLNPNIRRIEKKVFGAFHKDAMDHPVSEAKSKRGTYAKLTSIRPELRKYRA
ncbi:deoxyribodipyrimidine photo-lyase, partial [Candidatus Saccharibacteria bacterium]|nr:deoxyribodipyrimidine photo-lyase [Candidatus Saccharibacteria bacterium]